MPLHQHGHIGAGTDAAGHVAVDDEQFQVGQRHHVGVARTSQEHGGFADVVAEAVDLEFPPVTTNHGLAANDHVEGIAGVTLANELFACPQVDLAGIAQELGSPGNGQVLKEPRVSEDRQVANDAQFGRRLDGEFDGVAPARLGNDEPHAALQTMGGDMEHPQPLLDVVVEGFEALEGRVQRRDAALVEDEIVGPIEVGQFLATGVVHASTLVDGVDGGGVIEGVPRVVERRALVVGFEGDGRDRVEGKAKQQLGPVDVDGGPHLHRTEVEQLLQFSLGNPRQRRPFPEPRGVDGRHRPQCGAAGGHRLLQHASVVVAVDVGEDQAVDEAGVDVGVGEDRGRMQRRIHQDAPPTDPQDKARGALTGIGVEAVAATKDRQAKAGRHERPTAGVVGVDDAVDLGGQGWIPWQARQNFAIDGDDKAVALKGDAQPVVAVDNQGARAVGVVVAASGLIDRTKVDGIVQTEDAVAIALAPTKPEVLTMEVGNWPARRHVRREILHNGTEQALLHRRQDGLPLGSQTDDNQRAMLGEEVPINRKLKVRQSDPTGHVDELPGQEHDPGYRILLAEGVFEGLWRSAELQGAQRRHEPESTA